MADEEAAEVLGVDEQTDLIISSSSSSSSLPINVTCIFLNASSSDLSCSNNNLTEEADVVYPYKVRFTGGFVQPNNLAATLQSYADILAAAIPLPFHPPSLPQFKVDERPRWSSWPSSGFSSPSLSPATPWSSPPCSPPERVGPE